MRIEGGAKLFIPIAVIAFIFVIISFIFELYEGEILEATTRYDNFNKLIYIIITIFSTVVAPVSTLPLISVATNMWGWVMAGTLSIIGWSIGAQISFIIARRFGKPFVEKFLSLKKLQDFENHFSNINPFWTIVFLRMIIPVDILSYALGLFSEVRSVTFFSATLVGISPFAYIFAHAGNLPVRLQVIIFVGILATLGIVYMVRNVIWARKK